MIFKKPAPVEPDTVACYTCGHIVLKSSATSVLHDRIKVWFCSAHSSLYDERFSLPSSVYGELYYYYRKMRVDEFGVPIGYVKETE